LDNVAGTVLMRMRGCEDVLTVDRIAVVHAATTVDSELTRVYVSRV